MEDATIRVIADTVSSSMVMLGALISTRFAEKIEVMLCGRVLPGTARRHGKSMP